jgi:hypothetical protein
MKFITKTLLVVLPGLWLPAEIVAQPVAPAAARPAPLVVTDSTVRYYLARSLSLAGVGTLPPAERKELLSWAVAIGTRLVGRAAGFWYTPESDAQEQEAFETMQQIAAEVHAQRPEIILQGSLFEIVYAHVERLTVPNRLRAEFGEDTVAVPVRKFRLADMMYPGYFRDEDPKHYRWDSRPPGQAPGVPDMSQTETQLWFYYQATRQLDAGLEALHFGQVLLMDHRDPGHRAWWSLLQRIRAYARTRNRGGVLFDAHTHGEYYDPDPARPLPQERRQLLFNFHSFPLRPVETDTFSRGLHSARLDYADPYHPTAAIYGRSGGGIAPSGERYAHLPVLAEFDNGPTGTPGKPGQWPLVWGLDEIAWFATQPSAYRDQWLVYAHARIRQLDPNAYLQFPGLRGVVSPPRPYYLYRADQTSQGETMRAIWAGETADRADRMLFIGPVQP